MEIRRSPPSVGAGCALVASLEPVRFEVLTMAGPVLLERCLFYFRMIFDGEGRAWISLFGLLSKDPDGTCFNGVLPCRWEGGDPKQDYQQRVISPWPGRVTRTGAGRYRVRLSACVNSRMGRFEGAVDVQLRKGTRGWTASAPGATFGDSGLRLTGRWKMRTIRAWATRGGPYGDL